MKRSRKARAATAFGSAAAWACRLVLGAGAVWLVTAPLGAALAEPEIYQWRDEEGHIHFSDTPPLDLGAAQQVESLPGVLHRSRFTEPTLPYVRDLLRRERFERIELAHSGLKFSLEVPAPWAEVGAAPLRAIEAAAQKAASPSLRVLGGYFRRAGKEEAGLPILSILADPTLQIGEGELAEIVTTPPALLKLKLLQSLGSDIGWEVHELVRNADTGVWRVEFTLPPQRGITLRGLAVLLPTRRGLIGLLAYATREDYAAYRPIFLRVARSIEVPQALLLRVPAPSEASAPHPPGVPLDAGTALGIAIWMVCGLIMLMVHTSKLPRWSQSLLHLALAAASVWVARALARDFEETIAARQAFGAALLIALVLAWKIERNRGRASHLALAGILASALGLGLFVRPDLIQLDRGVLQSLAGGALLAGVTALLLGGHATKPS